MNKGIIYIIKCKDKNIKDCYIGSTTNLKQRIKSHKKCENDNRKVYQFIRNNGNFDNFYFEILEDDIEFNNKKELYKIEKYYIDEFKSNLNMYSAYKSKEDHKEYKKQYYKVNKNYYNNNKEKIKEQAKRYRDLHKSIISEKRKIKVNCECGSKVQKYDLNKHKKTLKHLDFVNNKTI